MLSPWATVVGLARLRDPPCNVKGISSGRLVGERKCRKALKYEIEIHGTWIQYRCVRPGTVDLGYYYVRGRIGNLDTVFQFT